MTQQSIEAPWRLRGRGYEFCNCDPGCTCNFAGKPNSVDGSCKTAIGFRVTEGHAGELDLSGIEAVFIVDWPGPIHEGGGRAVLCFSPSAPDDQVNMFVDILTGQKGGMPWVIASTTFDVVSVIRADVEIFDDGMNSRMSIEGVGQARGTTLKNPSTGEDRLVAIVFPTGGFIFDRADCGKGDFQVDVEDLHFDFTDTNWLAFDFDWSNSN